MARSSSSLDDTLELLKPFGPVHARAMFGGWGLFQAGRMFGLILDGRLYLKTDDTSRAAFEAAGGEPFVYDGGKGRQVTLSYWTPPAEVADDAHALLPWVRRAAEAALRVANQKAARKTVRRPKRA
ncbi:TfoX/Sxy family protein [Archangium primigenium]|uniref:TfoX/Sxy family protein n=1 Tax=[Archangium] primigenium TaxID=2792470 RepID=UPI00195AA090|nr:TfoX/Sxy family protein [Archangium primigenium]MBM7113071.1 TfoX/Sxy family protein [Archangium primigenium]